jgi:hypothetical protein
MTVFEASSTPAWEALSVSRVSGNLDWVAVSFDDPNLVTNAGLILVGTLEALINATVRLLGQVGGALPGRNGLSSGIPSWPAAPMSITAMCCVRATPPVYCPIG